MNSTVDKDLIDRVRQFRFASALTKAGKIKGNEHVLDLDDLDALLALASRLVEPDEGTVEEIDRLFEDWASTPCKAPMPDFGLDEVAMVERAARNGFRQGFRAAIASLKGE